MMNRTQARFLVGVIAIILAVVFYPVFTRNQTPDRAATCQSNLMQIGLAFAQYSQDYNSHYPPAKLSAKPSVNKAYGWADAVYPYIRSTQIMHCPANQIGLVSSDPTGRGYTDYWLNSNLSGFKITKILSLSQTIAVGDGNDSADRTDARYAISALPPAWVANPRSPLYRHALQNKTLIYEWELRGFAYYVCVDGHVERLPPSEISATAKFKPDYVNYSFLLR